MKNKFIINLSLVNIIINIYFILSGIWVLLLLLRIIGVFLIRYFQKVHLLVKIVNLLIVTLRKTVGSMKTVNSQIVNLMQIVDLLEVVHLSNVSLMIF